jgi:rRNA maturation endonuclease Nob1
MLANEGLLMSTQTTYIMVCRECKKKFKLTVEGRPRYPPNPLCICPKCGKNTDFEWFCRQVKFPSVWYG